MALVVKNKNMFKQEEVVMKKLLFILILALLPVLGSAQVTKAKAMLTLSFMRYCGWNEAARQGDFVIGVVRDKEMANWLKSQSAGKKFGFQDVVIKEYKSIEEVEHCQVIYVSNNFNFNKQAEVLLDKVGKDCLVITEVEGACTKGAMINFVVREEKLRFELHKKNAQFGGIQFSAKLEDMTAAINL